MKKMPLKNKILLILEIPTSIIMIIFCIFTIYNFNHKKQIQFATYEQVSKLILENKNLTEEEKQLFHNKKLLQDVIPYYNGTIMDEFITIKYNNLQIEYYDDIELNKLLQNDYDTNKTDKNILITMEGHYSDLTPNKIHIYQNLAETKLKENKQHEYIHLLQCSLIKYQYAYLAEASAELINNEYNEATNTPSSGFVKILKILTEIVGPKPIWKLNFASDDTELKKIIYNNLEKAQAEQLLSLLNKETYADININTEIYQLLEQLHYNIKKEKIENNPYIMGILDNSLKNRYYFNSDKINSTLPYISFKKPKKYKIQKEISLEEYLNNNYDTNKIKIESRTELDHNNIEQLKISIEEKKAHIYYEDEITELTINSTYDGLTITPILEESQGLKEELASIYESFPNQKIEKIQEGNSKKF